MSLDLGTVAILYRAELRMTLRDKRAVFFSLVLPLVLMPVMLFSSVWVQKRRATEVAAMTHAYAVCGAEAEGARLWIAEALALPEPAAPDTQAAGKASRPTRFELVDAPDPAAALESGKLGFYVIAEREAFASAARPAEPSFEPATAGAVRLTFVYRGDRDDSRDAASELRQRVVRLRRALRARLLERRGFPVAPGDVAHELDHDVAGAGQVAGLGLGRVLTLFLLLFVFTGGAAVATDSLAGEKERGTLETLLATAAGRAEIITAKSLLVLTSALVITVIQTLNFLVYVVFKLIPTGGHLAGAVSPATAVLLFLLYLPVIALVSSALLAASGWARSYKEAQLYFMPVMLLGLLPALAPLLPAVRLRSAIVVVPIANLAVAAKEILIGTRDWPFIAAAWLITALAAALLARATARMLGNERLVSSADLSREELVGGPALFQRRVLRAYALMWVTALAAANYLGTNVRAQLLLNIGGIFIGGSLFLIRRYRLDLKSALALRPVRPIIWLGVAAVAPAGLVAAIGLGRILNLVLPVPQEWVEQFARQLAPSDVPLWQMLPLLTILPGIGEEIAFRGVLLHGLRKRFRPLVLACVVGAIFGVFHFDLMRLLPVACLGAGLAAVTLLTGSIFPAMVWHALNNGLSVLATQAGYPLGDLPPAFYAAATLLLLAGFWVFWRNRTPYPDLRARHPGARTRE